MKKIGSWGAASLFLVSLISAVIIGCNTETTPLGVESILVVPVNTSLQVGETQQYMAIGAYSDGSTANVTGNATWESSDSETASIDSLGLVRAKSEGEVTITASLDGISASAVLTTVAAVVLESISLEPQGASILVEATQQYTAAGNYSDGSTATITEDVTWTSSNETVATIDAAGLATALAEGTTTIGAALEGVSDSATLTVIGPVVLESILVEPQDESTPVDRTQQFTATGTYTDESTADITGDVTWASSNETVATIDADGLVTVQAEGTADITAALEGVSGSATLTGLPPSTAPLESIAVTPAGASVEVGQNQQYTATGTYTDDGTAVITGDVTWASSNETVATIDAAGLATVLSEGTTNITATLDEISGLTALTGVVVATLESITVTPADASIGEGETQQYTATGTYSDSSEQDLTADVTWDSSDTGVATIDSAGLATAVSAGTSTITATLGEVSDSAEITVTAAGAPNIPAGHLSAGCDACHSTGAGAPQWPTADPDHSGFTSSLDFCTGCHDQS